MMEALSALDPHKAVLPLIALIGLLPVVLHYRDESKLFVVGYAMLIVATLATNLENLFLGDLLNLTEHAVGLMASGLAFFGAAYVRRQRQVSDAAAGDGPDAGTGSGEVTVDG